MEKRMKKNIVLVLLVIVFLILVPACNTDPNTKFVGTWTYSANGIVNGITLYTEETMSFTFTSVIVDGLVRNTATGDEGIYSGSGTYTADNLNLSIDVTLDTNELTNSYSFVLNAAYSISGNVLTLTNSISGTTEYYKQ